MATENKTGSKYICFKVIKVGRLSPYDKNEVVEYKGKLTFSELEQSLSTTDTEIKQISEDDYKKADKSINRAKAYQTLPEDQPVKEKK